MGSIRDCYRYGKISSYAVCRRREDKTSNNRGRACCCVDQIESVDTFAAAGIDRASKRKIARGEHRHIIGNAGCRYRRQLLQGVPLSRELPRTAKGGRTYQRYRGANASADGCFQGLYKSFANIPGGCVAAPKSQRAIFGKRPADFGEIISRVLQSQGGPFARGEIHSPWCAVGDDMNGAELFVSSESCSDLLRRWPAPIKQHRPDFGPQIAEDGLDIGN
jgi:hypothetical protein